MSDPVRSTRTRMAAVAGSLVLSLTLVSAPAVLAQDCSPEDTIHSLMEAIENKDFEAIPRHFAPEYADAMGTLDLGTFAADMPPGVDVDDLLDAFILDAEVSSLEVLSQTEEEAVVKLEGSLTMDIDAEALKPFVQAVLEASGKEVTPELVEMFTDRMAAEFEPESTDISEEITMAPGEELCWVIDDDLGVADEEVADEEATAGDEMVGDEATAGDEGTAGDEMAEEGEGE